MVELIDDGDNFESLASRRQILSNCETKEGICGKCRSMETEQRFRTLQGKEQQCYLALR